MLNTQRARFIFLCVSACFCSALLQAQASGFADPKLELVLVDAGTFIMGNPKGSRDEQSSHSVTLSSFLMGKTEITQNQFKSVMGYNPSYFSQGSEAASRPVERVDRWEAMSFCNTLSLLKGLKPVYYCDEGLTRLFEGERKRTEQEAYERLHGTREDDPFIEWVSKEKLELGLSPERVWADNKADGYRLPTEAEWEFAARGGTKSKGFLYSGSNNESDVAWHRYNGKGRSHPVAQLQPNELGLYDMGGNVWEWCWDSYSSYSAKAATNPMGPSAAGPYVQRGGSWAFPPSYSRSSARFFHGDRSELIELGFRVVRSLGGGEEPRDKLFAALEETKASQLTALLKAGASANLRDRHGETLLHRAIKQGKLDSVKALVQSGANLETRNRYGLTALTAAIVYKQDPAIARFFMDKGADLKARTSADGPSLLMLAACFGAPSDLLKAILAKGVSLTLNDGQDTPQLFYAVKYISDPSLIAVLFKPDFARFKTWPYRKTILMQAAEANASVPVLQYLLAQGCPVNDADRDEMSPLCYAARFNTEPGIVKLLLDSGARLEQRNYNTLTPLALSFQNPNPAVAKLLVQAGAEVDPLVVGLALSPNYDTELLLILLDRAWEPFKKADWSLRSGMVETMARYSRDIRLFEKLYAKGFTNKDLSEYHSPLLELAAFNPNPELLDYLVSRGFTLSARYANTGITLLMKACQGNNLPIARHLIKLSVKLNEQDAEGNTALHYAKDANLRSLLIKAGADPSIKNNKGQSYLQ